jgi:hypothetical protein
VEYFWKENKRFVVAVGGGFLFLLLYNSFVLGPIRAGAAEAVSARVREKRELERKMSQGVPNDDGLAAGRRDRDQSRKQLAAMAPEVVFNLPEKFQKPKRESVKSYFDNLKLDLVKDLQTRAVGNKVAMPPNLGLPNDISDETAAEVLSRLAAAERLVILAVDSEVEKIETLDAEYGMERDERSSKKSQFLTKYSVFMKVTGRAESIFRILHGAQKKGSFLALTHFEIGRPDATKDLFEASIGVALLKVDDKAGLESK